MPTQTNATISPAVLELMGPSAAAERARVLLARAAATSEAVLISAEPGLDPMAVARAIHEESSRAAGTLIAIDCAEGDAKALEHQLFGTSARAADDEIECVTESSQIRASIDGTLVFLNVDELPGGLQTRLARVLRDGEVETQSTHQRMRLETRVVAATCTNIEEEERPRGQLRRELQARFGLRLELPPLRHRRDDIPLLVGCLAGDVATACGVVPPAFGRDALTLLSALPWRRNLEELREVIEQLVDAARGNGVGLEEVLALVPLERALTSRSRARGLREVRAHFEREYIASVLHQCRGRMDEAARTLGMQRTNLYRKVRQLGIARVRFR